MWHSVYVKKNYREFHLKGEDNEALPAYYTH